MGTTEIDWYEVLGYATNAFLLAGITFLSALAGTAMVGNPSFKAAFVAALIPSGLKAFLYLAKVRGIDDEI